MCTHKVPSAKEAMAMTEAEGGLFAVRVMEAVRSKKA